MAILEQLTTPCQVLAYGSRVNGDASPSSDLDLVIKTADLSPFPITELNQTIHRLKMSNIPIVVELRDWSYLPESFHKQIMLKNEVIYDTISK